MSATAKWILALMLIGHFSICWAGDWSVIITGATWHAGDGSARRHELNSWQHTVGLDYTSGPWFGQASHMTDSYYCSSNEIAAGSRYRMVGNDELSAGIFGALTYVDRCGGRYDAAGVAHLARGRYLGPLAGGYIHIGSGVRLELLLLPTIPWSNLLRDNTPLVYAQLEVRL